MAQGHPGGEQGQADGPRSPHQQRRPWRGRGEYEERSQQQREAADAGPQERQRYQRNRRAMKRLDFHRKAELGQLCRDQRPCLVEPR
jgi:hypothetical protein